MPEDTQLLQMSLANLRRLLPVLQERNLLNLRSTENPGVPLESFFRFPRSAYDTNLDLDIHALRGRRAPVRSPFSTDSVAMPRTPASGSWDL